MKVFGLICGLMMAALCVQGQLNPVSWENSVEALGDNRYAINFTAELDPGWYIYSQYLESDEGPIATSITFQDIPGFKPVGKTEELGNKNEEFDPIFEMKVAKYADKVTFRQVIDLDTDNISTIDGYITFMVCDSEKCLPPTDVDFNVILK
jgi:thiol:disulfide interchange protein DsbD